VHAVASVTYLGIGRSGRQLAWTVSLVLLSTVLLSKATTSPAVPPRSHQLTFVLDIDEPLAISNHRYT
jgi:hypothetical protein